MILFVRVGDSCPFCSLMGTTLTIDVENADVAIVGSANEDGTFKVAHVLKGADLLPQSPETLRIAAAAPGVPTLALGTRHDDRTLEWEKTDPITREQFDYLLGAMTALQHEPIDLSYFFPYLGYPDQKIADDAFYQFARSKFDVLKSYRDAYDRDRVIELIQDSETMPELRTLAFSLLSIVGNESDGQLALQVLEDPQAIGQRGLASVISALIALQREQGLQYVRERYLENLEVPYELTHAAILAIRFHLKEADMLDRRALLNTLQAALVNPELADVVLPDLIAANDWTAVDRVVQLFEKAPADKRWIRLAAAKYLLAARTDEAKAAIEKLKKSDPSIFTEAESNKPVLPTKTSSGSDAMSRSFFDAATLFLMSPLLATAVIAVLLALLLLVIVRKISKKGA